MSEDDVLPFDEMFMDASGAISGRSSRKSLYLLVKGQGRKNVTIFLDESQARALVDGLETTLERIGDNNGD